MAAGFIANRYSLLYPELCIAGRSAILASQRIVLWDHLAAATAL